MSTSRYSLGTRARLVGRRHYEDQRCPWCLGSGVVASVDDGSVVCPDCRGSGGVGREAERFDLTTPGEEYCNARR